MSDLENKKETENEIKPVLKIDLLKDLEEKGLIDKAEDWDNLTIEQINHLNSIFVFGEGDEDAIPEEVAKELHNAVVGKRESDQKINALKIAVQTQLEAFKEIIK